MPFHSYIFFDTLPTIRSLSKTNLIKAKKAFAVHSARQKDIRTNAYALLGLKAGIRFALHINAASPDTIQLFVRDCMHTELGKHLKISYTLLGCTRASLYNPTHAPQESLDDEKRRYLVVYPFTKTIEWHLMPYEERRKVMKAHVEVGKTFSHTISQRLLYAYGIDDHEFIVSYFMNSLEDFQSLVMAMRETESRRHTKNDLPIFTCIHMPLSEALDMV